MKPGRDDPPVPRLGAALDKLASSLASGPGGLTSVEAAKRLVIYGPNDLSAKVDSPVKQAVMGLVGNPLVLILLVAAGVSMSVGDRTGGAIIIAIVVVSSVINIVQAHTSQTAIARLQSRVAPTATVLRDGKWVDVPRSDVVHGDVIRVNAGDLVPADARVLTANALHVRESSLTGEALPALKVPEPNELASESPSDNTSCLFFSTNVMSGEGTALVVWTGKDTQFGAIASRLAQRPPQSEFEKGLHSFSVLILKTVFFLVAFVFLIGIVARHDPLESLLFSVALAVGLTPEFLPMITTITLSQGAVRMAKLGVVVKNIISIQNLGSMDVLCSDKTGTLTSGEVKLGAAVDPAGAPSTEALRLAVLNSLLESGIESSLDQAVIDSGPKPDPLPTKLAEIPFDFERRRVSVVAAIDHDALLVCKGAPEGVMAACSTATLSTGSAPLDAALRAQCTKVFEDLSEQGFRVLAVASKHLPDQAAYTIADEKDMELQGFLTFVDPTLPDALETVDALERAGVTVKIISGDNQQVTRHVCESVGLKVNRIVTGDEIEAMPDTGLQHVVEECSVFARVSPAQKSRIILALKARSHVVGYMGDGINDAPSLHVADVGISVAGAVDVARDAADIILLRKSLVALREGIVQGRSASGNVMKYLLMGTSSNFGNMFSMAGATVFLPFLPMLPTQILLNNFLYDLSQVTIPSDSVDDAFTSKPLRWDIGLIRRFMLVIGPISSIYDFLTFFVLLRVFHVAESEFHTGWFIESLATQVLVIFVIRTFALPWQSRPSKPLAMTAIAVVAVAVVLPYSPFAADLGFVPLPAGFMAFVALATATYLALVEVVKRRLFGTYLKAA